jgi:hypothetical protein
MSFPSWLRSQRFRPCVEALEDRYTLAGTVTGSFSLGTWTLIGDAEANSITINPTANLSEFVVTGSSTAVAGVTSKPGVKNIVIKLFAGEDVVTFNDTLMQAKLAGNLTVIGGKDANDVFIKNSVVGKKVTVLNGTNATGRDNFEMTASIVKGKVFISNGDGNTGTLINRNSQSVSSIGGLTVINGTGDDHNSLIDTSVAGNVVFKNGLPDAGNNAGYLENYNSSNTRGARSPGAT